MTPKRAANDKWQPNWKLIVDGPRFGHYNMALDEVLLNHLSAEGCPAMTYVRFYQWARPTVSFGFTQDPGRILDWKHCQERGIDIVRRITGGKAVLHDQELTYSVVSNDQDCFPIRHILQTYRQIGQALVLGFRLLGLETTMADSVYPRTARLKMKPNTPCFALDNHHEIQCEGRKLVGSAQRRTQRAFLQHGSILFTFDAEALIAVTDGWTTVDLNSRVTSLSNCLGFSPAVEDVITCLVRGLEDSFKVELSESPIEPSLIQAANELGKAKYGPLEPVGIVQMP